MIGPEAARAVAVIGGLIEFGGALIVTVAVARALAALVRNGGIDRARLLVIGGTLGALGYKGAATFLKAIELGSWHAIGTFAAIFTLRTAIKQLFAWERARVLASARAAGRF